VNQAVAKILTFCDKDSINEIRVMCDLPDVSVMVERRRMKFMNNMLDSEHFRCMGSIYDMIMISLFSLSYCTRVFTFYSSKCHSRHILSNFVVFQLGLARLAYLIFLLFFSRPTILRILG